jgi:hypothetical protein
MGPLVKDNTTQPRYEPVSSIDILVQITRGRICAEPFAGDWKDVFLQALALAPIVSVAARIAGVSRKQAIEERNADAEFARRWHNAMEDGVDEIEAAAFLSAVYGNRHPVFYQGLLIGWTTVYSDAMRAMLLKGRRSAVFGKTEETKQVKMQCLTLEEFEKRFEEAKAGMPGKDFA